MPQLEGTQTEKNLLKAFAGESQARMRYDYFAKQAKKEWLEQISGFFEETSLNEKEHAKRFFKFLEGRMVEITATYPAGKIGTTLEIWKQLLIEKRKNGRISILNLLELLKKNDSQK